MESTKVTLKLLIDTEHEKVLFAEASKEVVDFLFNLLSLPISTVIRLVTKKGMVGCLSNLYESIENLNDTYMQPSLHKDSLLNPTIPFSSTIISGLLPSSDNNSRFPKLYQCNECGGNAVTHEYNSRCTQCYSYMTTEVQYIDKNVEKDTSSSSSNSHPGFVKGVITYMVMDDLVIQPMSTISSITLLNQFNVKEIGVLKEKVVELGVTEGIKLLKASLQSKMVFTSVFLKNVG